MDAREGDLTDDVSRIQNFRTVRQVTTPAPPTTTSMVSTKREETQKSDKTSPEIVKKRVTAMGTYFSALSTWWGQAARGLRDVTSPRSQTAPLIWNTNLN